jgi:phosphomannomutase
VFRLVETVHEGVTGRSASVQVRPEREEAVMLQISVSGIRGIVGEGLDAVTAARWTAAFGSWLEPGPVVVGRDTRPSGEMVRHAVLAGLTSTGHDALDIGVATTPTTEMEVAGSEAVGGVIITASHNPQPWNALKFLAATGLFLTSAQNARLQERLEAAGHVAWDRLGRVTDRQGAAGRHVAAILALPWLRPEQIASRSFHVVVDAVEGAGGEVLPTLLQELGVRVTALHCGMSGLFPHEPEPTPANLTELSRTVAAAGADLGLAVDPDGDRLALVDGAGRPLSEELTLVLAMDFLLGRESGPVAVNLSTTSLVERVAGKHGVEVHRTPVGEANVVEVMQAAGAVIGGEGNGGVIYPALHPGRDALVGTAMILQLLTDRRRSLAAVAAELPPAAMIKEKVAMRPGAPSWELADLLKGLGAGTIDARDGMKWSGPDRWIHVRPSNTEPVMRIIAEAPDPAGARELVDRVKAAAGL